MPRMAALTSRRLAACVVPPTFLPLHTRFVWQKLPNGPNSRIRTCKNSLCLLGLLDLLVLLALLVLLVLLDRLALLVLLDYSSCLGGARFFLKDLV
jgi:hypothetical protein